MPKFVIEREIPGLGNLTDAEIQEVSRKSVAVLKSMGTEIQWLQLGIIGSGPAGLSAAAHAAELGISVRTVDNLLSRAYTKLGVSGRDELADALLREQSTDSA